MSIDRFTIVSGGQTGVDRAALDEALSRGIPAVGWCPAGRLAEDGPLDERYPLLETPRPEYSERTRLNVRDSDATLIIAREPLRGGTLLTRDLAIELRRPVRVIDPRLAVPLSTADWIAAEQVVRLNVAGPRASEEPTIYDETRRFLSRLFDLMGA